MSFKPCCTGGGPWLRSPCLGQVSCRVGLGEGADVSHRQGARRPLLGPDEGPTSFFILWNMKAIPVPHQGHGWGWGGMWGLSRRPVEEGDWGQMWWKMLAKRQENLAQRKCSWKETKLPQLPLEIALFKMQSADVFR